MFKGISRALLTQPQPAAAATSLPRTGPNSRAVSAVEAFLASNGGRRHALLIDGPWGVGKTHFHNTLKASLANGKRWLYVSVYGASSKAEIDNAVFAAAYPMLTGKGAAVAGAVAGAFLKHLKVDWKLAPTDVLTLDAVDVIVFDDLERSRMPSTDLLGYLNTYVEHGPERLKVLLLANLAELPDKPEFDRTREKVVGRTLRIVPDVDAAFTHFVSRLGEPERQTVVGARTQIEVLFTQSGLGNLRLLDSAVEALSRVIAVMEPHHRANPDLIKSVVDLITVFALELGSNGVELADLQRRHVAWAKGAVGGEPTAIRRLAEKYPNANLLDEPVSDAVLESLFVDGVINREEAQDDLGRSRWYVTAQEAPWRLTWRAYELSDDLVEPAIDEMNRLWDDRAYTVSGEILHVFGIRLHLSEIGRILLAEEAVLADGLAYIDEVFERDRLEDPSRDRFERGTGHDGLGFMQAKSVVFQTFARHLDERRAETTERRKPAAATELFEELKGDPELFSRRILQTGGPDSRWSRTALLQHIDPEAFAAWLADQHPALQRDVMISLSVRYEHGVLERELAPERAWLVRLRACLETIADARSPVARDRLRSNIKWFLNPVIDGPAGDANPDPADAAPQDAEPDEGISSGPAEGRDAAVDTLPVNAGAQET